MLSNHQLKILKIRQLLRYASFALIDDSVEDYEDLLDLVNTELEQIGEDLDNLKIPHQPIRKRKSRTEFVNQYHHPKYNTEPYNRF